MSTTCSRFLANMPKRYFCRQTYQIFLDSFGACFDLELLVAVLVQRWAESEGLWSLWMVFAHSFGLSQSTSRINLCLLMKWEYTVHITHPHTSTTFFSFQMEISEWRAFLTVFSFLEFICEVARVNGSS